MLQVINSVLKDPDDHNTKLSLVFANKSPEDILLRAQLDELAQAHDDRFKVTHHICKKNGDGLKKLWLFLTYCFCMDTFFIA